MGLITTVLIKGIASIFNFGKIWSLIKAAGKIVLFATVLSFTRIMDFVKSRKEKIERENNRDKILVSLKLNLNDGRFNVANAVYDTKKQKVTDIETSSEGYENCEMDKKLKNSFGDKDMIVYE